MIRAGDVFGLLTVLNKNGDYAEWSCLCACGATKLVRAYVLLNGRARSCGCRRSGHVRHNKSGMREYNVWVSMKQRCKNEKSKDFKYYGARGIKVCARWDASFEAFLSDMGPRPTKLHSIERVDVDGDYEPSNCVWATAAQQSINKRVPVKVKSATPAARKLGLSVSAVYKRVKRGWSVDEAMSAPRRRGLSDRQRLGAAMAKASVKPA